MEVTHAKNFKFEKYQFFSDFKLQKPYTTFDIYELETDPELVSIELSVLNAFATKATMGGTGEFGK